MCQLKPGPGENQMNVLIRNPVSEKKQTTSIIEYISLYSVKKEKKKKKA